jgi:hypothetical protein
MGKTAVKLPDPLDKSVKAGAGSADDLLAQLAGEEIDRLLSEAEGQAEPEPAPTPLVPPPVVEAPAVTEVAKTLDAPAPSAEADKILDVETPAEAEPPVAAQAPPAPPPQATPAPPPPAKAPAPTPPPPRAPTVMVDATALAAKVVAQTDMATSLVERSMLDLSSDGVPAKKAHHWPAWLDPVGWLVKVLEWINAPLKSCPDSVRNALGSIALLTLFNAMAVLVYVFFFRKPHP